MDKRQLALEEYEDWNWLFAFEHDNAVGEYMNGTMCGTAGVCLFNKQTGGWRGPRTLRKVYPGLDVDLFVAGREYAKGGVGDTVAENFANHIGTQGEKEEDE